MFQATCIENRKLKGWGELFEEIRDKIQNLLKRKVLLKNPFLHFLQLQDFLYEFEFFPVFIKKKLQFITESTVEKVIHYIFLKN